MDTVGLEDFRELGTEWLCHQALGQLGTVKMENEDEQEIVIRRCTEPIAKVKEIYAALKYKERPFCQRKFVVPLTKIINYVTLVNTQFRSG